MLGGNIQTPLSETHRLENGAKINAHSGIFPLAPGLENELMMAGRDSIFVGRERGHRLEGLYNINAGVGNRGITGFSGAGLHLQEQFKGKIHLRLNAAMYAAVLPEYLNLESTQDILPGIGERISGAGDDVALAPYLSGSLGYTFSKNFHFEVGRGKHFWGDGYRSGVMSHNASPFPYAKLTTAVWNIKYVNVWGSMKDISAGLDTPSRRKFTTMHALSWNIHKRFNMTIFESVVWQSEDSLSQRNFELNYLNPLIFYRPVEFAQGSADNALLGVGFKYRGRQEWQAYTQIYFDEFLLFELRRALGWWGNKFSFQLGLKKWNILPGLHALTEINLARPYTYTHGSVFQAYGHLNQSLAHPLETNFVEWVNHWTYEKRDLQFEFTHMWAIYGRDKNDQNFGGNIFRSYANPAKQYDNYLAQGLKSSVQFVRLRGAKNIGASKNGIQAFAEILFRHEQNEDWSRTEGYFNIGLRSPLYTSWNDR